MSYLTDTSFLIMVFILPMLFGFSLMADGVMKVVRYENRGWFGILTGVIFMGLVIFAYFYVQGIEEMGL